MFPKQKQTPDRRSFFRDASLITAAAIGATSLRSPGLAAESEDQPVANQAEPIDLGAKPTFVCSGPALLPRTHHLYVSFHATRIRSDGRVMGDGTAMIQLGVCADHNVCLSEISEKSGLDFEGLAVCETFEIKNSSWAASWNSLSGSDEEEPALRHFAFTFLGMNPGLCERASNFECLAATAKGFFVRSKNYGHVVRYADYLEVRHNRALRRRR